jgi:hypothetical protein
VLTDRGRDLLPVVLALVQWGAAHTDGSAPLLTHAGCGEAVQVEVRCAEGHVVAEQDIVLGAPSRG